MFDPDDDFEEVDQREPDESAALWAEDQLAMRKANPQLDEEEYED